MSLWVFLASRQFVTSRNCTPLRNQRYARAHHGAHLHLKLNLGVVATPNQFVVATSGSKDYIIVKYLHIKKIDTYIVYELAQILFADAEIIYVYTCT